MILQKCPRYDSLDRSRTGKGAPSVLFNSFSYLLFLPIVFGIYWAIPRRFRVVFLVIASYFFYMSWRPIYGLLIVALTAINFGFGHMIATANARTTKKTWLITGLIANLACLAYFKYTNFMVESYYSVRTALGTIDLTKQHFDILLPLGISFFTFEFIHYIVDIYRGQKPITRPLDFALFASFFPSQIAGPIKRYEDFRLQTENLPSYNADYINAGTQLLLQGFFKKVALGDNLGLIASHGFTAYATNTPAETWLATLAFTFQIFFDFSGYTDIGRGSALLLGFKVPENFDIPYLATSPTDFWNRWHKSLSTWLRDYLFIPLGGSRHGKATPYRNLIITMGLSGLWHGAAWHFVIWGLVHAALLIISKEWQSALDRMQSTNHAIAALRRSSAWNAAAISITFVLMVFTWLLFRADDMHQASRMCASMFDLAGLAQGMQRASSSELILEFVRSSLVFSLPAYGAYCWVKNHADTQAILGAFKRFWLANLGLRIAFCVAISIMVLAFAPGQLTPFIYFQF